MTHSSLSAPDRVNGRSLRLVAARRGGRRIAVILLTLTGAVAAALVWIPWQQTIVSSGEVMVFSVNDRPQTVEAQIPGRLVEWRVEEGQAVREGDIIARLADTDSKFLDDQQAKRLLAQQVALKEQKGRASERVGRLTAQVGSLSQSREAAISTARQRVQQARQRRKAAEQSVVAAGKGLQIASDVAKASAREKAAQARDRVLVASQAVEAARQNLETVRLQRERVAELFQKDLRSRRDDELAENELVKSRTEVRRAELALEVARRDATVGGLEQSRAGLETERVQTDVERARAALDIAERDVATALLDLAKITSDTAAAVSSVEASLESARESAAKIDSETQKLLIDRQNVQERVSQQIVRAPRSGKIVRLLKVGTGATVKAGDILATVVPDASDRAVSLSVADNDVPLLAPGRKVRLQFAGWPAVQFAGFPSVSTGTFGGIVSVIDAVDDGTARYRVVVKPDYAAIAAGAEQPWPDAARLRPGAEASGWILLDTVPLGYELWRQFNAFPLTVKRPPVGDKSRSGGAADKSGPVGKAGDKDGEKDTGVIKLKSK